MVKHQEMVKAKARKAVADELIKASQDAPRDVAIVLRAVARRLMVGYSPVALRRIAA